MNRQQRRARARNAGAASPTARGQGNTWLAAAMSHASAGRLAEAEQICRQLLALDPGHAGALHLQGLLAHRQGRLGEAITLIEAAIARQPRDPAFHHNLGNLLREQQPDAARRSYERALALAPDSADTLYNLGVVHQELGRDQDAIDCFERALRLRPDVFELHHNLGTALEARGRFEAAIACYRRALALRPDAVETLDNLGGALRQQGRLDDADRCFVRALALRPERPESLIGRGLVARDRGSLLGAIGHYRRALAAAPDHPAALADLGVVLVELGHPQQAVACQRQALALQPDNAAIRTNLGVALEHTGDHDAALAAYERALAVDPQHASAHVNRAHALLLTGRFEEGWREYEWRFAAARYDREFAPPRWNGEALAGKTILVHAEQGFGDTIQFVRYLPLLAARGARVVLEAPARLIRLLRAVEGVTEIVAAGDRLPDFDCHCPLLSLPLAFATEAAAIPAAIPYLAAEPARVRGWRQRLPQECRNIGIAWQGNPQAVADRLRSIPLAAFAPLAPIPRLNLVSLQKNDGVDQLATLPAGLRVQTLGPDFDAGPDAFLDTAAVMMTLDLVISCDTAIAHLAGALGRPLWVVLAANPDWRWLLHRSDSPWYPTARLFRQKTAGDWTAPITEVAQALYHDHSRAASAEVP